MAADGMDVPEAGNAARKAVFPENDTLQDRRNRRRQCGKAGALRILRTNTDQTSGTGAGGVPYGNQMLGKRI